MAAAACAANGGQDASVSAQSPQNPSRQLIDHLVPARDSVGAAPTRFSWTRVQGDVRYEVGVWNEVDAILWRQRDLREPSAVPPKDLKLEPGTYWWGVIALSGDRLVAESGRAAFVVR